MWTRVAAFAVALNAIVWAILCRRPLACDDAAITFRYVSRIASGHGFAYNDHERVLGTSNPLYTLILSTLHWLGADIENAATAFAIVCVAASALFAMHIAGRLGGPIAGAAAGFLLPVDAFFLSQALSGLETAFSTALGLLFAVCLLEKRDTAAGVVLGLAVWNKLDAGILALAFAASWVAQRRSFPWRVALVSFLTVAPWLVFSLVWFGTPIPNSFVTKLTVHERIAFQHDWVINILSTDWARRAAVVAAFASLLFHRRLGSEERLCHLTLLGWLLLHGLTYSIMSLGAYYPWYLTVLPPLIVVLGSVTVGQACSLVSRLGARSLGPTRRTAVQVATVVAAVIVVGAVASERVAEIRTSLRAPAPWWEVLDVDMRMAGAFIRQYGDPEEVVAAPFGWIAYEVPGPFIDLSGLNSREQLEPIHYLVGTGVPHDRDYSIPAVPQPYVPVASFNLTSDVRPGVSWVMVAGHPDSKIVRSGRRFIQRRLFELPGPSGVSAALSASGARVEGNDLLAPAPSGVEFDLQHDGQPVHLVFTPARLPTGSDAEVVFQVRVDGEIGFEQRVGPTSALAPVILPLEVAGDESNEVAFITFPSDDREGGPAPGASWKNVKVVIGDAYLDVEGLMAEPLRQTWLRHTPSGGASASIASDPR